jgi:hypothetical protein
MSEEQYQTILATTADLQTSVDSIDRRLELASPSEVEATDQDVEVTDWINSGARDRVWAGVREGMVPAGSRDRTENDEDVDHYAPPGRQNTPFPTGLVILAALGGSLGGILFLLWTFL